ncbi:MAG: peptidylprolyl isomerase, partial [Cytophagales bacterium]|nr:peptidylprolyl isomerase [Cytophagales bacterium]
SVQKMQEKITEKLKVTPSEVKRFYNNMPQDSVPYFSSEVEVAQIVKIAVVGKEEKNAIRARLNQIRGRIVDKGEDFAELARNNSADGSAADGGDLGWAKRGMMVPEFEGTAMKLKKGEVSQVIETEFGFHLLQLLDRKGEEYRARHILVRPNYSDADLVEPTRYLDSLRTLILADSMKFENAAKEYSEDKATKGNGGVISDPNSRSSKIFMEALDPGIYFTIDTMEVGEISKPVQYRTDDGKTAMRIIYFRKKIPPHHATLEEDWEKIAAAALNEKKAKALNNWFKKAKDDVFINIHDEFKECNVLQGRQ